MIHAARMRRRGGFNAGGKVMLYVLLAVWMTVYVGSCYLIDLRVAPVVDLKAGYVAYLSLATLLLAAYGLFRWHEHRHPDFWRLPWQQGALLAFGLSIVTPVTLETDQLRYIWDGLQAHWGINPYRFAPEDAPGFQQVFWAEGINHQHLSTIYPPFAQLCFQLSTVLNPFFWFTYLGANAEWLDSSWWSWLLIQPPSPAEGTTYFLWRVEFGWKVLIGLMSAWLIYLLRCRFWLAVVLHPLFLLKFLANGHIDSVMACFLLCALKCGWNGRHALVPALSLGLAILTKWLPLVFVPFFVAKSWARFGKGATLWACLCCVGMGIGLCLLFAHGADGGFLRSTWVYGEHWYFFGYLHRIFADILGLTHMSGDPIQMAKVGSALFGSLAIGVVGWAYAAGALSLRLACLWVALSVFAVFPTLHPWYLLTVLVLGAPYSRVLITPWLWPALALYGQLYYYLERDPIVFRYALYSVISVCLCKDAWRSFSRTQWWQKDTYAAEVWALLWQRVTRRAADGRRFGG